MSEMRSLGAVRVRSGHLEVAFASPAEQDAPEPAKGVMERINAQGSEVAELEELRAFKRRMEELGVE